MPPHTEKTYRIFTAVPFPEEVRTRLMRIVDDIPVGTDALRRVRPDQMHVTLHFFAALAAEKAEQLVAMYTDISSRYHPFTLSFGSFGVFPDRRRPRVLWLGIRDHDGTVVPLKEELDAALRARGFPVEHRPFKAHLTVGRFKEKSSPAPFPADIFERAVPDVGEQRITHLEVIRSELSSTGPRYTVLASCPFKE